MSVTFVFKGAHFRRLRYPLKTIFYHLFSFSVFKDISNNISNFVLFNSVSYGVVYNKNSACKVIFVSEYC